jgi:hypothetical protein
MFEFRMISSATFTSRSMSPISKVACVKAERVTGTNESAGEDTFGDRVDEMGDRDEGQNEGVKMDDRTVGAH